jgi:8-oxo-dGTP pyrophosphatase MutT (NUDIX family)
MSDWLARARREAAAPPLRPRVRLDLVAAGGPRRIGSIEPAIAERIASAGLPLRAMGDAYFVAAPADESLAAIARWLRAAQLAAPWRDELLAVAGEDGRSVGTIERAAVRVLGLATEAVHLVGVTPAGETWVQQRAFAKSTDPGRWDTLMGGQVAAGESIVDTLARETMEEAGLAIADLRELACCAPVMISRPVREGYMVERIEVFRAVVPDGAAPTNRDGEVERFERLADAALVDRLRAGEFTLEATLILGAELERRGNAPDASPAGSLDRP